MTLPFVIWYDTANPDNATAFGPGYWLLIAFALAAGLVMLIDAAIRIRG
jgi:hypothetical protein